MTTCYLFYLLF